MTPTGTRRGRELSRRLLVGALALLAAAAAASAWYWQDDALRTTLDPKQPFQTYRPPPAPDYARADAWALLPAPVAPGRAAPPADVFFVHPTTFDGGRNWNGAIDDPRQRQLLAEEGLPNYAGPFARSGRVFAPRYRQASLYATWTLRDDARDARDFAYGDVKRAFDAFLGLSPQGRPIVLVGVEQGGLMVERLAREALADSRSAPRIAAVYLIDVAAPASAYGPGSALPACASRRQARCVVAYAQALQGDFTAKDRLIDRGAMWAGDEVVQLRGPALCVNPTTGSVDRPAAPESANLGAAAAARLEWGARPALLAGQVSTTCRDGILRTSSPRSPALHRPGGWPARLREPPFNLFWADLEADVASRVAAYLAAPPVPGAEPGPEPPHPS